MRSYRTIRLRHYKINNSFSEWKEVFASIPQSSILVPLLFNIFSNDIFLFPQECDLANYADGRTMYACNKSVSNINSLSHESPISSKLFYRFLIQIKAQGY